MKKTFLFFNFILVFCLGSIVSQDSTPTVVAYKNGEAQTPIDFTTATTSGTFIDLKTDVDSVVVTGIWVDSLLVALKHSMKNTTAGQIGTSTNTQMIKADFSAVRPVGQLVNAFQRMFQNYSALKTVILPEVGSKERTLITNAFNGASQLQNIANLDKFSFISSATSTFANCAVLEEVHFKTAMPGNRGNTFDGTKEGLKVYLYPEIKVTNESELPTQWQDYTNIEWIFVNTALSSLTISAGTLSPVFHKDSLSYKATVANSVTSVDIAAIKADSAATVEGAGTKTLVEGPNTFVIKVTKAGVFTEYTLIITRELPYVPSANADLASLSVSRGTLTPAFHKDSLSYTVEVSYDVSSLTIAATAAHDSASVDGDLGAQTLTVGSNNVFNVVVTAENESTRTYEITVTREAYVPSSNADLATLSVSVGTLSPAFHKDSLNYTVEVANEISGLTISAVAAHDSAEVSGTGQKTLNVGTNPPFNIQVTAENGNTKNYAIVVTRATSSSTKEAVKQAPVKVYPNPVSQNAQIFVELPADKATVVSVYDAQGKIVSTQKLSGKQSLAAPEKTGVYFLRFEDQNIKVIVY